MIIDTIRTAQCIKIPYDKCVTAINRHHINKDSNRVYDFDDKRLKFVDHPNIDKSVKACNNVFPFIDITIDIDLHDDGTLSNPRIIEC